MAKMEAGIAVAAAKVEAETLRIGTRGITMDADIKAATVRLGPTAGVDSLIQIKRTP